MPTQFNSPTRRSYPERRRERPCDASTTCQRVIIMRGKLKRCQFRQTEVLGDERASYAKIDCPFCSSEGAISFLKEFHNEQYIYDVTETDVHLRIGDRGTSGQALRSNLRCRAGCVPRAGPTLAGR